MNDARTGVAHDASDAASALARKRWGDTRVNHLVSELRNRADQLGDKQLAELQELVDAATEVSE
jgi:hypothetical protein